MAAKAYEWATTAGQYGKALYTGEQAAYMRARQEKKWDAVIAELNNYRTYPQALLLIQGSAYQSIARSMLQDIYLSLRSYDLLPQETRNTYKQLSTLLLNASEHITQVYGKGLEKQLELAKTFNVPTD